MLSSALYPNDDPKRHITPPTFRNVRSKDLLWMMSLRFMPQTTPMWVGWNSLLSPSNLQSKRQNGWYLPQINLSPTSYTVVAETLNRGIQIANECSSQSLCITYDLAIVRMAMKIQQEESPKYDRLFINIGSFHFPIQSVHT